MEPDVSGLLARWARQDPAARDELGALVHGELRKIAHHYLRHEREGHTLQTDALVNEAYLRLAGVDRLQWRDRTHFFAIAAMLMRRVLVDYARERGRDKRGGGISITSLDEGVPGGTRAPASDRAGVWGGAPREDGRSPRRLAAREGGARGGDGARRRRAVGVRRRGVRRRCGAAPVRRGAPRLARSIAIVSRDAGRHDPRHARS